MRIEGPGGGLRSRLLFNEALVNVMFFICLGMFLLGAVLFGMNRYTRWRDDHGLQAQQEELVRLKNHLP